MSAGRALEYAAVVAFCLGIAGLLWLAAGGRLPTRRTFHPNRAYFFIMLAAAVVTTVMGVAEFVRGGPVAG
jgi:hypothetical protein